MATLRPAGELLREWRRRRRKSQLDLALDAGISTRHLSFLETGRARPSREMALGLAEQLAVPLRERNELLMAAGFAPVFPERGLDDPGLQVARQAIELVLKGHEPYPALAVDRHWTLVSANAAVAPLLSGAAPALLRPPVNVLRLSLHPDGLAPRIVNYAEWREHVLARLRSQILATTDAALLRLADELRRYPGPSPSRPAAADPVEAAIPFRIRADDGAVLSFITTTTVFGTPADVTLAELAIESFFPADRATADAMRRLVAANAAA